MRVAVNLEADTHLQHPLRDNPLLLQSRKHAIPDVFRGHLYTHSPRLYD